MTYDDNFDSIGTPDSDQDELWLEDLKSLLDEDPGTAPSPGNMPAHSVSPQQRPGTPVYPDFSQQMPPAHFNDPARDPQGFDSQMNANMNPFAAQAYPPQFQQDGFPPADGGAAREEKPRKRGYTSIIVLSILIVLEALAIAAVAFHWMQWMQ